MSTTRRTLLFLVALGAISGPATAAAMPAAEPNAPALQATATAPYISGEVVVEYAAKGARTAAERADTTSIAIVKTRQGESVHTAIARLKRDPRVVSAEPNYVLQSSADTLPNKLEPIPGGGLSHQWNFLPTDGVNAPGAWNNLIADGHPGGKGQIVAVLDTGVAYADKGRFKRSPDLSASEFVMGMDFVNRRAKPFDRNGHGTHVTSTIAEQGKYFNGLAYGVRIRPIEVLNAQGEGNTAAIAAGIRFSANKGDKIANMSFEYGPTVHAADIPAIVSAVRYALSKGELLVAAAGNEGAKQVALPARLPGVLAVGATTQHLCVADYSNFGPRVDIVAPGGGADAAIADPNCHPHDPAGADIFQVTFRREGQPGVFGIPDEFGTSMAAPHVSATAALIIASGVLGPHPTRDAIVARLKGTARKLGTPSTAQYYGAGLVDAAAATAGPPVAASFGPH